INPSALADQNRAGLRLFGFFSGQRLFEAAAGLRARAQRRQALSDTLTALATPNATDEIYKVVTQLI
ncbi:MAG: hypothetical protein LIO42_02515, partial [Oscillospiraceae bacterium]|nr:hypothetical protein [Oscillospiraceae bacterium]